MTEPDVALTDYAVAAECALLTGLLFRGISGRRELRRSFALLFASAGIAALAGGTVHGFFLEESFVAGTVLWRITLLALGLTACAAWSIGGRLIFAGRTAQRIEILAGGEFVAYAIIVLAVDQRFWIAIVNYVPSVVFLAIALALSYRMRPAAPILAGFAGVVLTMVAAVVQRCQIALYPVYFNHNALYHLIQMSAFILIFLAGRHFIAAPAAGR